MPELGGPVQRGAVPPAAAGQAGAAQRGEQGGAPGVHLQGARRAHAWRCVGGKERLGQRGRAEGLWAGGGAPGVHLLVLRARAAARGGGTARHLGSSPAARAPRARTPPQIFQFIADMKQLPNACQPDVLLVYEVRLFACFASILGGACLAPGAGRCIATAAHIARRGDQDAAAQRRQNTCLGPHMGPDLQLLSHASHVIDCVPSAGVYRPVRQAALPHQHPAQPGQGAGEQGRAAAPHRGTALFGTTTAARILRTGSPSGKEGRARGPIHP